MCSTSLISSGNLGKLKPTYKQRSSCFGRKVRFLLHFGVNWTRDLRSAELLKLFIKYFLSFCSEKMYRRHCKSRSDHFISIREDALFTSTLTPRVNAGQTFFITAQQKLG